MLPTLVKYIQANSMNRLRRKRPFASLNSAKMMLQGGVMADSISANELRILLDAHGSPELILLDCRAFFSFNEEHIVGSNNVICSSIVKRRSGGNIPLDSIIRCANLKSALVEGRIKTIIAYDEATHNISSLERDSTLYLVLKCLNEEISIHGMDVKFVEGGYTKFSAANPQLCSCETGPDRLGSGYPLAPIGSTSTGTLPKLLPRDTVRCHPSQDQEDPVQILPWLYLGNAWHASQEERLLSIGITALLNVSRSCDVSNPAGGGGGLLRRYKAIPVEDNCMSDISCWFPEAIDFIETVHKGSGKVLVHCQAGISRSATICIAYLMFAKGFKLDDAYDYLKSKRSLISPNLNFMRQLSEFETELDDSRRHALGGATPDDPAIHFDFAPCSATSPGEPSPRLKRGRPSMTLALTPCTQQATFVFDSPCSNSPTLPICHSPLVSPS